MSEHFSENPYAKLKCQTCGSMDWAHAHISPVNLRPLKCDRCPPKDSDIRKPKASKATR